MKVSLDNSYALRISSGDLASLLDLKPVYSVADVCENLSRVDQGMFEQCFVRHSSGVHLLAAPRDFRHAEKVTAKGVRQTIAMARRKFPYLVVDLENTLHDEQMEALWQSEIVLLVLRLDYTSLRNTRRVMRRLVELGLGADHLQLVVNRYGERRQLGVRQAEEALGMKIGHYIPNDPSRINRAVNAGVPVVLQRPSAKVSRRIAELAVSVNGHHRPSQLKPNGAP